MLMTGPLTKATVLSTEPQPLPCISKSLRHSWIDVKWLCTCLTDQKQPVTRLGYLLSILFWKRSPNVCVGFWGCFETVFFLSRNCCFHILVYFRKNLATFNSVILSHCLWLHFIAQVGIFSQCQQHDQNRLCCLFVYTKTDKRKLNTSNQNKRRQWLLPE